MGHGDSYLHASDLRECYTLEAHFTSRIFAGRRRDYDAPIINSSMHGISVENIGFVQNVCQAKSLNPWPPTNPERAREKSDKTLPLHEDYESHMPGRRKDSDPLPLLSNVKRDSWPHCLGKMPPSKR